MSEGEICARDYATGEPVQWRWKEGTISSVEAMHSSVAEETWLAPPLVDLQINGFAGVDFQQDHLTLDEGLRATRGLRDAGCTTYLLTLITDEWSRLMARLRHLRELRSQSAELQRAIAGWHI